jgi:solute carrier family 25 carnitine/acylcarnitine transporter 20/29
MTHNERRTHWIKEGSITFGIGIIYGVTVTSASHVINHLLKFNRIKEILIPLQQKPFDTVKTKMQAQAGFENSSMLNTFSRVFKAEGIKGLYRYYLACFNYFINKHTFY